MEYLGYILAIFIGVVLGLIGGGGSILTVPILVYLFQIKPEIATSYSLFIVGITAVVGAYRHYLLGNLKPKPAVFFAIPSVISLLFTRKILLPFIPSRFFLFQNFEITKNLLIMMVFAVLMITASILMIKKSNNKARDFQAINYHKLSVYGFMIGFVIGFVGAGGGFLIIPVLLFFANLPMKQAVGTSLLIIFINSTIGFAHDVISGVSINFFLLLSISGMTIIGMLIGTTLSKKIDGDMLKPAFGWFVLVIGFYILIKELF